MFPKLNAYFISVYLHHIFLIKLITSIHYSACGIFANKVDVQTLLVLHRDHQMLRKNYQSEIMIIQSDHLLSSTFMGFTFPIPLKQLIVSHRVKACSPKSALHISIDNPDAYSVTAINLQLLQCPVSIKTFRLSNSVLA